MPPSKSKRPPLTSPQIATLRQWIAEGAEVRGHWAFLPLSAAPPPSVKGKAWVENGIANFTFAKLKSENIAPSPEADREIGRAHV